MELFSRFRLFDISRFFGKEIAKTRKSEITKEAGEGFSAWA
jgi:hypothetical protein